MLTTLKGLTLAVRFGLELVLLGVVAAAVWQAVDPLLPRLVAAAAGVAVVSGAWVALVHGTAVPPAVRAAAQVAALALGAYALVRLGAPRLAAGLTGVALVNAAMLAAWTS